MAQKFKLKFDPDIKSSILKTISSEIAASRPDLKADLNQYYKDPGGGGGGLYGKGNFGKSDPPKKQMTVVLTVGDARSSKEVTAVIAKIKAGKLKASKAPVKSKS
jgi:hypothetical protein